MHLSVSDKVKLLRELVRGAPDCFAAFVLTNREGMDRWRPVYSRLRDDTLKLHLRGLVEIGTYPMIPDIQWPRVYWICADFDGKAEDTDWKKDVQKAVEFLDFEGCPCIVNLSRSGQGAHVRLLFKESVPAWLARRWMTWWLEEAGVLKSEEQLEEELSFLQPSFDRLIPPQDTLSEGLTFDGRRRPGNLAGAPLHGGHARDHGGTLPLDPARVVKGDFEPDGNHWAHVAKALEERSWSEVELKQAIGDLPDEVSTAPPTSHINANGTIKRALPVVPGDDAEMAFTVHFCEFFKEMRRPGTQTYPLWMAMASQLHRFDDAGYEMWHELSALDPRYDPKDCQLKWQQTEDMHPVRCDTLIHLGYRCPRLDDCGSKAPSYFANHANVEIL